MRDSVQAWTQGLASIELPVTLVTGPFLLFPEDHRWLAGLAALPVWIASWIRDPHWRCRTPFQGPLVALLGLTALNLWVTFDLSFTLDKVATFFWSLMLVWALARWISTPKRLAVAFGVYLAGGVGIATGGMLVTRWPNKWGVVGPVVSAWPTVIAGITGAESGANPNALAGLLLFFTPVQASALWCWLCSQRRSPDARDLLASPRVGAALFTGLLVEIVVLVATQSRGAGLGLVAAAVMMVSVASARHRILVGAVVVGLVIASLFWISDSALAGRREIWSQAWEALLNQPLTGMGIGTFRFVQPELYPIFSQPSDAPVAHAHNQWLQAGLDLGIGGMVAYACLYFLALRSVGRLQAAAPDAVSCLALGLGGALLASLAFGVADAIPFGAKAGVAFWGELGLLAGLASPGMGLSELGRWHRTP